MAALTRLNDRIFVMENGVEGVFDAKTGKRVRGKLDWTPDEVLFWAWAQTQPVNLKETKLRSMWQNLNKT